MHATNETIEHTLKKVLFFFIGSGEGFEDGIF
jgi:hypothetical protein